MHLTFRRQLVGKRTEHHVVATIPVGPVPRFLAADEGAVGTLNRGDGSVKRIDPAINLPVLALSFGMEGGVGKSRGAPERCGYTGRP